MVASVPMGVAEGVCVCVCVRTITTRSGIERKYVLVRFDYSWVGLQSATSALSLLLSAANEGANHNWQQLLHEVGGEGHREGPREVYAD